VPCEIPIPSLISDDSAAIRYWLQGDHDYKVNLELSMAYFDSDGVQIYYEEHGAGEPVVLASHRAAITTGALNGSSTWRRTIE
jgi:hypothetical protein